MFPLSVYLIAGLLTLVIVFLSRCIFGKKRQIENLQSELRELEFEEERMFHFLHDLGVAIEKEQSDGALSRMIVDGVIKVLGACGGAIYTEANEKGYLNPTYVSEECPALVNVPNSVLSKARIDPRILQSHLRLARVKIGQGIIGETLSQVDARNIDDVGEGIALMVAPLRYAGKDIGVLAVTKRHVEGLFSKNDFAVFRSVAEQSSFAIGNARLHREANEKKKIEGELQNAREVQRVLLPQKDPLVSGFRINGTNLPARLISGDYYDYIHLPDRKLGVVIADVSGKGVSAGLLMAMCRSLLRAVSKMHESPSAVLSLVNRHLFPDIREDMFISMIYGILDPEDGSFTFSRAGHEPALIFQKSSHEVILSKPKGIALGIDQGNVFERVTADEKIMMQPGDCLLLVTDGVKEALNAQEEEFGLERLSKLFRDASSLGAEGVVNRVLEELNQFTGEGPQMDDITIVVVEKR